MIHPVHAGIRYKGFTIVELVVVIVVVGILAGVAILAYGAWRQDLMAKAVQSDLRNAYSAMNDARTWSGEEGYPEALPGSIDPSQNVELTLAQRSGGTTFCIEGQSTQVPDATYYVSNRQSEPTEGTCEIVTTQLAGNISTGGWVDDNGANARFTRNEAVAVDSDGVMFVADNAVVRKVMPNGDVTTYAGGATSGSATGPALSAYLRGVRSIAVDTDGNVYPGTINDNAVFILTPSDMIIANYATNIHLTDSLFSPYTGVLYAIEGDNYAGKVYKFPSTGGSVKTLIAGNATNATIDGTGAGASLYDPRGLAVSPNNDDLYICENNGGHVRKVTQAGVVTTFAGPGGAYAGGANEALYSGCGSVEVDKNGNVYVTASTRLQMIRPSGEVITLATLPTSMSDLSFDSNGALWASSLRAVFKINIP